MSKTRASLLYLQMGQEVTYILLASAIATSLLLLSIAARTQTRLADLQDGKPMRDLQIYEEKIRRLQEEVGKDVQEKTSLDKTLKQLQEENAKLKENYKLDSNTYNNDQPPIILLTESAGYTFETGSAEISSTFRLNVKTKVLPDVIKYADRYSAHIIEIIGHTDEVAFGTSKKGPSDLDTNLFKALNGGKPAGALIPFDNVGLGMARAISVRQLLLELGLGADFIIFPLSAGPAITPSEAVAAGLSLHTGEEARRRIEIRLRRKSKNQSYEQHK